MTLRTGTMLTVLLAGGVVAAACSDGTGPGRSRAPLKFIAITVEKTGPSTCGLAADSTLYCWGVAWNDQLGTPTTETCDYGGDGFTACSTRPLRVVGAPKLASLMSGQWHHCGIDPAGVAYCWGSILVEVDFRHIFGQVPTVLPGGLSLVQLDGDRAHVCGTAVGGAAYCWGDYYGGLRGDGTVDLDTNPNSGFTPNPVSGGLSFTKVVASRLGTCGLTTTGSVYCWGGDFMGGLGDPAAPTQVGCGYAGFSPCMPVPNPVAGGLTFTSLSAGWYHFCGMSNTGAAYCWGEGTQGQLIDDPLVQACSIPPSYVGTCAPTPVVVAPAGRFVSVTAGGESTCALDAAGLATCWGSNDFGQLGTGGGRYPAPVLGGHAFRVIVPGAYHSCGLTADSLAYCWGANTFGSLGDGTTQDSNEPVAVIGPSP